MLVSGPLFVSMLLGFVVYSLVLLPFSSCVKALKWLEDNTANGIVGILGFLLYLVGAIVHARLDWVAPP